MTARLKLSRVLLIFGLDGDNNIQDPAAGCFVTFLHNGRVQISTNTTNGSAGHTRGCWVLGSCLVLTHKNQEPRSSSINNNMSRPPPSLRRAESKWNKLNPLLCFVIFCSLQEQDTNSAIPDQKSKCIFQVFNILLNNQYHRLMVVFMDPCNNQMTMDIFANSCILATIQASTSHVYFVVYSQFLNCLFNSMDN